MNKIDNGGPAFPCTTGSDGGTMYDGMTLRDWFAGMALGGFCSQTNAGGEWTWGRVDAPKCAYEIADAMIAERNKTTQIP